MTPDGPVYNFTMTPEYRLWASNPEAFEQLMLQRQMAANAKQQQEMLKQQQAFDKWLKDQKAKKDKGQATDPAYDQLLRMQAAAEQQQQKEALRHRNTRRRARTRPATPKAATAKAGTSASVKSATKDTADTKKAADKP
jgi:hypothetical protein